MWSNWYQTKDAESQLVCEVISSLVFPAFQSQSKGNLLPSPTALGLCNRTFHLWFRPGFASAAAAAALKIRRSRRIILLFEPEKVLL